MSEDPAGTVRLHTGDTADTDVLGLVRETLDRLRHDGIPGMLAFADLVQLARDSAHELSESSWLRAYQAGLIDADGVMKPHVAAVVRACAVGDGVSISAVDPTTGS